MAYQKDFYETKEWRRVRLDALAKNDGRCCLCGRSKVVHGVVLHVDHIKPRSKYPELELDPDNLMVLCEDCNLGKSNRYETDWRKPVPRNNTDMDGTKITNDRAYLHAFRNGFNREYCSSNVKKFTTKEIRDYEDKMRDIINS